MTDRMALVCTGCGQILDPGAKVAQAKAEHAACSGRITTELVSA